MKLRARRNECNYREPKSKRQRVAAKTPTCIQDLIAFVDSGEIYSNIDVKKIERVAPYLRELNNMVGMKSLKESVFNQILYYLQGFHYDCEDYLHTVIYGEPGCGKTEVSKIIGQIYSRLGLLSCHDKFITATRADLIGQFLGETSIKTTRVLQDALGGVLFIDEVYSLGNEEGRDFYAKECIDTINLFISENKDDLCLIIAGYESDIENCFFSRNKGLKRRFPWVHRIDKYDNNELVQIMKRKVGETSFKLDCTDEFLEGLVKDNKDAFKFFGGSIENLLAKSKIHHARRVFGMDKKEHYRLNEQDIQNGLKELKGNDKVKDISNYERMFL